MPETLWNQTFHAAYLTQINLPCPASCLQIPIIQTEKLEAHKAGDLGRANNQLVHSEFQMELGGFLLPDTKRLLVKKITKKGNEI